MPLSAHARPRETRYWLQMQVGLYVPLNPPPLAHRGSWNVWVVNNYQRRSKPLNVWNIIHHATNVSMSPEWKGNKLTCACITFESRSMPALVHVGFEKEKVKEDIPKPRQCHICWKLGHAKKHCEGIPCWPDCGTLPILCSNAPTRETAHTRDTVLTVMRMDTQPFLSCVHYTEEKRKYFSSCIDRVLPRERLESCLLILADMQTLSTLEDLRRVPIPWSPPTNIIRSRSSSSNNNSSNKNSSRSSSNHLLRLYQENKVNQLGNK